MCNCEKPKVWLLYLFILGSVITHIRIKGMMEKINLGRVFFHKFCLIYFIQWLSMPRFFFFFKSICNFMYFNAQHLWGPKLIKQTKRMRTGIHFFIGFVSGLQIFRTLRYGQMQAILGNALTV